jgi:hypothetical protein
MMHDGDGGMLRKEIDAAERAPHERARVVLERVAWW